MAKPEASPPEPDPELDLPIGRIRYSLPELLREVKRDRASSAFAMEKLDQAAITTLFEQQRSRRAHRPVN